jgi:DNA-binding IclR family transcriptional regulator
MEPLTRITAATVDVLDALLEHPDGCWGLLAIKRSGRPAGTVYPVLDRLERAGWVVSNWEDDAERPGPRRRYYRLTIAGAARAVETVAEFRARNVARTRVLSPAPRARFAS